MLTIYQAFFREGYGAGYSGIPRVGPARKSRRQCHRPLPPTGDTERPHGLSRTVSSPPCPDLYRAWCRRGPRPRPDVADDPIVQRARRVYSAGKEPGPTPARMVWRTYRFEPGTRFYTRRDLRQSGVEAFVHPLKHRPRPLALWATPDTVIPAPCPYRPDDPPPGTDRVEAAPAEQPALPGRGDESGTFPALQSPDSQALPGRVDEGQTYFPGRRDECR